MKRLKTLLPLCLCGLILIGAVQLLNLTQNKLLDRYTYQTETLEKEEQQSVYYIDQSDSFTLYPWNYYEQDPLIALTDLVEVGVGKFGYMALAVYGEEVQYIPFEEFQYSTAHKIAFVKDYQDDGLGADYCYSIAVPYQDYLETQMANRYDYLIYTDSILSFVKTPINPQDMELNTEDVLGLANELNTSLDNLDTDELWNYADTVMWHEQLLLYKLLSIYQQDNFEIYSTSDAIYVVFTNDDQKTTFLFDPMAGEFVGFSVQA